MRERSGFYERVLQSLLDAGAIDRTMSLLVVCGGDTDRAVLNSLGFQNVTVSNVDDSGSGGQYAPYTWAFADAESLPFEDQTFDVAIVSAGLHHCHSPHRGLLELYRVSRIVAIGLEARDSVTMRLASRAGLTDDYEISAVAHQGLRSGGVANTSTPNYVYRWTEREVQKAIASYAPAYCHDVTFLHELELPVSRAELQASRIKRLLLRAARPAAAALVRVAPRQANHMAFVIRKPRSPADLQPWMTVDGIGVVPNRKAIAQRYEVGP